MVNEKLVPKIRFSEFTEDWEEKSLGDILSRRKKTQKISKDAPLLAFAAGQGVIDRSERKTNNRDFLTKDSKNKTYLLTEYNDIVYNPSNLKYGAIDRNSHGKGVISPIYVTFVSNISPLFMEYVVKSHNFQQKALKYEEGTVIKRQSVHPNNLVKIKIKIPKTENERIKIANFLSLIDKKMELLEKKHKEYQNFKKYLMQQIFAQKLRFNNEDWDSEKLGKLCKITMGQSPSSKNYSENPNDTVLIQGNADIIDGKIVPRVYTSQITKTSKPGDIILTVRAPVGDLAINEFDSCIGRGVCSIEGDKFIYYSLQSLKEKHIWERFSQGSTFESINSNDIKNLKINIPSQFEQKKIEDVLSNVDDKIELIHKNINDIKKFKKGLLQQMFV